MGELIFDFNHESDYHYNSDHGCQISASNSNTSLFNNYILVWHTVKGSKCKNDKIFKIKLKKQADSISVSNSEDTIEVDSNGVISNNNNLYRLELYYNKTKKHIGPIVVVLTTEIQITDIGIVQQKIYYSYRQFTNSGNDGKVRLVNLKPISEDTLKQTDLDKEYEALSTTLTLNIKIGTCVITSTSDNTTTSSDIVNIKLNGPTKVEHSYSFIFFDYEFSSKGFNNLEIESTSDDPCNFEDFKGSSYNNVNLDKMRVYCSSDDLGRNLPLLIQFSSKSHYKFPDSKKTNTSDYYELCNAEETKVITSKAEDGSTLTTETLYRYKKYYKKSESLMETGLLDKLQSIYDNNKVGDKLYKMIPESQKQISSSTTAGVVVGVLGLVCIPAGVLAYIHHTRVISTLRRVHYRFRYLYQ